LNDVQINAGLFNVKNTKRPMNKLLFITWHNLDFTIYSPNPDIETRHECKPLVRIVKIKNAQVTLLVMWHFLDSYQGIVL